VDAHLRFRCDVGHRCLDDRFLAERGEDLRDVAQEGPARTEDENAVATQRGVVVQQESGTVESDRSLSGTGTTLDGQKLVQWCTDDLVLLGLDGGDDVEHLSGACPLELGQQRVAATQPSRAGVLVSPIEEVIGNRDDRPSIHHDLAPSDEPQWFPGARPVEGDRDRCPPVHDDGVGLLVFDVTASDVPGGTGILVDPAEEEGPRALGQERHAPREGGDVIEIGIAGGDQVVEKPLGSLPHRRQRGHRVLEVFLFGLELWVGQGRGNAHHGSEHAKKRANEGAQKSPDMPGIVPLFQLQNKASSWDFPFWSVRTLNL